MLKNIIVAIKGFFMGAANVVPGVSGGTIALLTGIYEDLINALNSLMVPATYKKLLNKQFKEFWKDINGTFLIWLMIGVLASIFSLAKLMEYVINWYPIQTWGFFFGMIAASAVVMLMDVKKWKVSDIIWAILGGILGVVICTLSPTQTPDDLWFIFICGAIAICTMILPGVSGSFVLLILGKYEYIMSAVNNMNLPVLVVFAIGCAIGILAFAKFLHWLLAHHERQTMLVLVGFVIGSLVKVWPWNDPAAIVKAQFLADGMSMDAATTSVDAMISAGAPIKQAISNLHVFGASIWAVIGVALVGALQFLSVGKETKEA